MFIIKELDLSSLTSYLSEPTYKIIGYFDKHPTAYAFCMKGKKYEHSDYPCILPGCKLHQYLLEEVKPLDINKSTDLFNEHMFNIFEVPVNLDDANPIDYVGKLFKNKDDVFNIPPTINDLIKSNMWFSNVPVNLHIVSVNEQPKIGDWGVDKNGFTRKYTDYNMLTPDVRKIIMSTNPIVKLPFTSEMMEKLKNSTNVSFLKKMCATELNRNIEVKSDSKYIKNIDTISNTLNDLKQPSKSAETKIKWTTFEGKVVDLSTMDHQHLSNIYWYNKIFTYKSATYAIAELKKRFNGEILEYKPLLRFKQEIDGLRQKGLLKWVDNDGYSVGTITYDGRVIGTIMKVN